jgi:hypothetical protein
MACRSFRTIPRWPEIADAVMNLQETRRRLLMRMASLCALCVAPHAARAAEPSASAAGFSEAEHLLFQQPHLDNVRPPRSLLYRYASDGPEGHVDDLVRLVLTAGSAGACCSVRAEYLTASRALHLPDITDARSNPVLLYFLEQQVRGLQRRTGGQAAHFRRMTRLSLAAASITGGTVRWDGADVPSRTVRVAPYLQDRYRDRFEAESRTEYDFVLADAVPGRVYRLRAVVPGTPPVREETVTLEGLEGPSK